jgi:hypothetical protein
VNAMPEDALAVTSCGLITLAGDSEGAADVIGLGVSTCIGALRITMNILNADHLPPARTPGPVIAHLYRPQRDPSPSCAAVVEPEDKEAIKGMQSALEELRQARAKLLKATILQYFSLKTLIFNQVGRISMFTFFCFYNVTRTTYTGGGHSGGRGAWRGHEGECTDHPPAQ